MSDMALLRPWEIASVVFFAYAVAATIALPGLAPRRRMQALGGAAAGIAIVVVSIAMPPTRILHEWLLPPSLLLLAYWASGRIFVAPMPAAERALERIDSALNVRALATHAPRWLAELLEFAYAGVYPLIPIALGIYLLGIPAADADRFWAVILVTDYVCFGVLPWIQTRPPRALEAADPWRSRFRAVNLRLLGAASIHVNTFPSGHAAEALAAALLVVAAPLPLAIAMFVAAAAISAGAVLGRYHYAADAILGWAVALVVWWVI
jgi:hypothetical protein